MNDEAINNAVNDYIRGHLSPKARQRAYITLKYGELKGFLSGHCFRSGSYPRYTAIHPVHDLDVIYPVTDMAVLSNPTALLNKLCGQLQEQYKNSQTKVRRIYAQTHSVTVELADSPIGVFSFDIVPAIELDETNEYDECLYLVPEILRLNRYNRQRRYEQLAKSPEENPIEWIKSDPRGYIQAASDLNDQNSDFRHTAKLMKSWRHACKMAYKDDFRLKSFHLEQVVSRHFIDNPGCSTVEAVIDCFAALPSYLGEPQFPDRADHSKFIDEYVAKLTREQYQLILRLQADAFAVVRRLPASARDQDVVELLQSLTTNQRGDPTVAVPVTREVTPRQPWGY